MSPQYNSPCNPRSQTDTDDRTVEVFFENKKSTFRLITSGNAIKNTHGVGFLIRQDKDILIKEIKAEFKEFSV